MNEKRDQTTQSIRISRDAFDALKDYCGKDKKIGPTATKMILDSLADRHYDFSALKKASDVAWKGPEQSASDALK